MHYARNKIGEYAPISRDWTHHGPIIGDWMNHTPWKTSYSVVILELSYPLKMICFIDNFLLLSFFSLQFRKLVVWNIYYHILLNLNFFGGCLGFFFFFVFSLSLALHFMLRYFRNSCIWPLHYMIRLPNRVKLIWIVRLANTPILRWYNLRQKYF